MDELLKLPDSRPRGTSLERGQIRRLEYNITTQLAEQPRWNYRILKQSITSTWANRISARFHWNTVDSVAFMGPYRPKSAFYSIANAGDKVVVEHGSIYDDGSIVLHDLLRSKLDFTDRHNLRSGHIGRVRLRNITNGDIGLALFDHLRSDSVVTAGDLDYFMMVTMMNNNIYPVTAEGNVPEMRF